MKKSHHICHDCLDHKEGSELFLDERGDKKNGTIHNVLVCKSCLKKSQKKK